MFQNFNGFETALFLKVNSWLLLGVVIYTVAGKQMFGIIAVTTLCIIARLECCIDKSAFKTRTIHFILECT